MNVLLELLVRLFWAVTIIYLGGRVAHWWGSRRLVKDSSSGSQQAVLHPTGNNTKPGHKEGQRDEQLNGLVHQLHAGEAGDHTAAMQGAVDGLLASLKELYQLYTAEEEHACLPDGQPAEQQSQVVMPLAQAVVRAVFQLTRGPPQVAVAVPAAVAHSRTANYADAAAVCLAVSQADLAGAQHAAYLCQCGQLPGSVVDETQAHSQARPQSLQDSAYSLRPQRAPTSGSAGPRPNKAPVLHAGQFELCWLIPPSATSHAEAATKDAIQIEADCTQYAAATGPGLGIGAAQGQMQQAVARDKWVLPPAPLALDTAASPTIVARPHSSGGRPPLPQAQLGQPSTAPSQLPQCAQASASSSGAAPPQAVRRRIPRNSSGVYSITCEDSEGSMCVMDGGPRANDSAWRAWREELMDDARVSTSGAATTLPAASDTPAPVHAGLAEPSTHRADTTDSAAVPAPSTPAGGSGSVAGQVVLDAVPALPVSEAGVPSVAVPVAAVRQGSATHTASPSHHKDPSSRESSADVETSEARGHAKAWPDGLLSLPVEHADSVPRKRMRPASMNGTAGVAPGGSARERRLHHGGSGLLGTVRSLDRGPPSRRGSLLMTGSGHEGTGASMGDAAPSRSRLATTTSNSDNEAVLLQELAVWISRAAQAEQKATTAGVATEGALQQLGLLEEALAAGHEQVADLQDQLDQADARLMELSHLLDDASRAFLQLSKQVLQALADLSQTTQMQRRPRQYWHGGSRRLVLSGCRQRRQLWQMAGWLLTARSMAQRLRMQLGL